MSSLRHVAEYELMQSRDNDFFISLLLSLFGALVVVVDDDGLNMLLWAHVVPTTAKQIYKIIILLAMFVATAVLYTQLLYFSTNLLLYIYVYSGVVVVGSAKKWMVVFFFH